MFIFISLPPAILIEHKPHYWYFSKKRITDQASLQKTCVTYTNTSKLTEKKIRRIFGETSYVTALFSKTPLLNFKETYRLATSLKIDTQNCFPQLQYQPMSNYF